jgi:hypothetical protein
MMITTLAAHIQLDRLREGEQRLRAMLAETQRGEYTRSAFVESFQTIILEIQMVKLREMLNEVARQLRD